MDLDSGEGVHVSKGKVKSAPDELPAEYEVSRLRFEERLRMELEAIMARGDSHKLRRGDLEILKSIVEDARQ